MEQISNYEKRKQQIKLLIEALIDGDVELLMLHEIVNEKIVKKLEEHIF